MKIIENKKIKDSATYKVKKGGFMITLVLVVLLILVFIILPNSLPAIIFNSTHNIEYYYVKDDNDFYNTRDKKIGERIFDRSFAESEDIEVSEKDLVGLSRLDFNPIYDEKNEMSIYLKNYHIDTDEADLIIDYLNDDKEDIVIKNIDKNFYKINNTNDKLVYIKTVDDKKNLYINKFNENNNEVLISENVNAFYADDNFNNIYYTDNGDLFSYKSNDNKKLISTGSEIIVEKNGLKFDDILRSINYTYLYITKNNNDEEKTKSIYKLLPNDYMILIVSNASGTPIVYYVDNFIYFYKQDKEPLRVSDYVVDDITDGSFYSKEPNINNYYEGFGFFAMPDYFSYYTDKAAFDQIANYIANNKDTVDKYIDQINRGTYNNNYNKLYCYDGNNEYELCKDMVKTTKRVEGFKPYIYFESYVNDKLTKTEKNNLSDIIAQNLTVNNYMKTIRGSSTTYKYIYHKKEGMRIEGLPEADSEIYRLKNKFVIKYTSGANQSLYQFKYLPGSIVSSGFIGTYMTNELKLFASPYMEDVVYSVMNSNVNAYLFVNGKRVEDEIMNNYIVLSNDLRTVVYFVEYDSENKTGKLKIMKNGKTKLIEENVLVTSIKTSAINGQIYFINNFNNLTISGDFYRYDDYNQKRLVSNNVMSIINDHIDEERIKILKEKDNSNNTYTVAGKDLGENSYEEF